MNTKQPNLNDQQNQGLINIFISDKDRYRDIFTDEAIDFINELNYRFNDRRLELLKLRVEKQKEFDSGKLPDFYPETISIREGEWSAAPIPADLQDRRVEITGPVDRKMIINALNSGASTFMADFEDSNSPTWENIVEGQRNLRDAIRKTISLESGGKSYKLNEKIATLIVRPRGLHLNEDHYLINDESTSGSLLDFGLYLFHNAKVLLENGSGPYFYLPKLEDYTEARWWNDVFKFAQDYIGIPQGSIKVTVLIETITASFNLHEIIYELKDHMAGLNCGRWDYIFSFIKKLAKHQGFTVPDRSQITMESPFMAAYSLAVIEACHKRKVHAMGGMAAQIPVKNDEEKNRIANEKVRKDKLREVKNGHDGTWVAHPGLVPVAKEIFDENMPNANQIDKQLNLNTTQEQLLELPKGNITEQGIRENVNVGILYLESWLAGKGAAALYNLMEDAATAEISRTQLWLWLNKKEKTNKNKPIDKDLIDKIIKEEIKNIKEYVGDEYYKNGKFDLAIQLFKDLVYSENLEEFLTLKAYEHIK